jgi:RNA polymerase sigma-70 factor (ECF subfamily)
MQTRNGHDTTGTQTRSDAELLAAARADARPFRELYERYAARIYGYHVRRCREDDAALDLTAETFARAWLSRERFRDEANGSAGPWLFAIARHVLLTSVRQRRLERGACARLGILEQLDRERADSVPDEGWLDGLDAALAELPAGQQEAIRLRVVEDLDYEDVATRLGTTPRAARVRVHRGLHALRNRFDSTETTR